MADPSKRLLFLEKLTSSGSVDPMAWYGLAMEYKNAERIDDALAAFESLREKTPDYVAMYLMCGTMLEKRGDEAAAREWLTEGIAQAKKKGDSHALGELESALENLGEV
jgi:predicted Zn-dependent protease